MGALNPRAMVRDVIVIGASAGGVRAVTELLSRLPANLPAYVGVVIHRGAASGSDWSEVLGAKTRLHVVEPRDGAVLARGVVYVAPSDQHMSFVGDRVVLDGGAKQHGTRPAVDQLFTSAAHAYGSRVVGVVLTGGGQDGLLGLLDISNAGGLSLVQEPAEAKNPSMPANAIAYDHVHAVLPVEAIADALTILAAGGEV